MKRLKRAIRNPATASVLLSLGVFVLFVIAREYGLLQPAEILAYDKFLVMRGGKETTDSRVAVVEITEKDIGKYDFPIPDDLLARLLETIARAQPVAIGLDIYRDAAVPRDKSRLAELNRVLKQYPNIVGIFGFGDLEHPIKIPFAPALAETPERYGFNDFPFEFGAVRRAFCSCGTTNTISIPRSLSRSRCKRASRRSRQSRECALAKRSFHVSKNMKAAMSTRLTVDISSCSISKARENSSIIRSMMSSAAASAMKRGVVKLF